jgi:hypothetical protein
VGDIARMGAQQLMDRHGAALPEQLKDLIFEAADSLGCEGGHDALSP